MHKCLTAQDKMLIHKCLQCAQAYKYYYITAVASISHMKI